MPDESASHCYECHTQFGLFKRRHHCRVCGQIFCAKLRTDFMWHALSVSHLVLLTMPCLNRCSNIFIRGEPYGFKGEMRVCSFCNDLLVSHSSQQSLPVAGGLQAVGTTSNQNSGSVDADSTSLCIVALSSFSPGRCSPHVLHFSLID